MPNKSLLGRLLGGRSEQAGIIVAAASVPSTFQRTLMPRSAQDQGIVSALNLGLSYGAAVLIQDGIESVALLVSGSKPDEEDSAGWRRTTLLIDAAAIASGLGIQVAFSQRDGESINRGIARTFGYWLAYSSFCGGLIGLLQEGAHQAEFWTRRHFSIERVPVALPAAAVMAGAAEFARRRREEKWGEKERPEGWQVSAGKSLAVGAGAMLALAGVATFEKLIATGVGKGLSAVFPGSSRFWRPAGHLVSLGTLVGMVAAGMDLADRHVEEGERRIEAGFDEAPESEYVSGGPGSVVSFESMGKQGRRFVSTVLRPIWIDHVMKEEGALQPIRIFVGMDSAPDEDSRVELAMKELERTGAFDRDLLMVISPTGTGYVNYVAVESAEYYTRGNIASVAMQYSQRPSVMSLDKVWEGRHHQRKLIAAIHERLQQMPERSRPRVVLFGESLGAHTSQDAYLHKGTQGLLDRSVDRALWIGTPYESGWKNEVLGPPRDDTDKSLIGVFDNYGQVEALEPDVRDKIRYVMLTHDNDAVAKFGPDLLVRAPDWLGDREKRPPTIPKSERWTSPTTFLLTLIDMKNSANVVPGKFEAKGHDYRADLARFIRWAYRLDSTDEQLAAIEGALRTFELDRKNWIDAHSKPKEEKKQSRRRKKSGNTAASEKKGN